MKIHIKAIPQRDGYLFVVYRNGRAVASRQSGFERLVENESREASHAVA